MKTKVARVDRKIRRSVEAKSIVTGASSSSYMWSRVYYKNISGCIMVDTAVLLKPISYIAWFIRDALLSGVVKSGDFVESNQWTSAAFFGLVMFIPCSALFLWMFLLVRESQDARVPYWKKMQWLLRFVGTVIPNQINNMCIADNCEVQFLPCENLW